MSLGPAEILVVLVVALVLFGPKRLPEVSRQVGGALRELRKIQDTVQSEMRSVIDEHVGPVTRMSPHEPPLGEPLPPTPPALTAGEPDLGDEQRAQPAPDVTPSTVPHSLPDNQVPDDPASDDQVSDDPGRPGIDGLSGGSFS